MTKFNVGDKVRVVQKDVTSEGVYFNENMAEMYGNVYTIDARERDFSGQTIYYLKEDPMKWLFIEDWLELVHGEVFTNA